MRNRFYASRTRTDCALVAIINALHWLKYPISLRDYNTFYKFLNYSPRLGTKHSAIHRVLKSVPDLKVSRKRVISGTKIAAFLNSHNTAVLYSYRIGRQKVGHMYLLVKGRRGYGFINLFRKPTAYWIKTKLPTQVLKTKNGFPVAWFLEREYES